MLKRHLELVSQIDPYFALFLERMKSHARRKFYRRAEQIESVADNDPSLVLKLHREAHDRLKRVMVPIQERSFQHLKAPRNWPAVVKDEERKRELFAEAYKILHGFQRKSGTARGCSLYGNIKSLASMDQKQHRRLHADAVQRNELDTWDAVRFRIVSDDLKILLGTGLNFWEHFFDQILRCRNFFYLPKSEDDPYRAIHFQVLIADWGMVEVQMLTRSREVVTQLDYAHAFKRVAPFESVEHEIWLKNFRRKGNILDYLTLKRRHLFARFFK
jgi:hypothetical protein